MRPRQEHGASREVLRARFVQTKMGLGKGPPRCWWRSWVRGRREGGYGESRQDEKGGGQKRKNVGGGDGDGGRRQWAVQEKWLATVREAICLLIKMERRRTFPPRAPRSAFCAARPALWALGSGLWALGSGLRRFGPQVPQAPSWRASYEWRFGMEKPRARVAANDNNRGAVIAIWGMSNSATKLVLPLHRFLQPLRP